MIPHRTRALLVAGLAAYLLAAIFCDGFIHPDEHFQILEFAHARLGLSPLADLPWEFQERIRPALQPVLAMGALWLFRGIGVFHPFVIAMALRIGMAVLSWLVYRRAVLVLARRLVHPASQHLLALGVMGLWFVPLLATRFSSENLSAVLLLAAVLCLLPAGDGPRESLSPRAFVRAGVLCGLAFWARFQMGLALLGIGLWLLTVARTPLRLVVRMVLGFVAVVGALVLLDGWFYGQATLTPWRYFVVNLVQHRAAQWGVAPFWWYVPQVLLWSFPLVGLPLIVYALRGIASSRRDVLLYWLVPFFVGHSFIGHKELRFVFPALFPVIYLAVRGWDARKQRVSGTAFPRWLGVFVVVSNLGLLGLRMLIPLSPEVGFAHAVWRVADAAGPTTVLTVQTSLYEGFGLPMHFYRHPAVRCEVVADRRELEARIAAHPGPSVLAVFSTWEAPRLGPGMSTRIVYSYPPAWTQPLLPGQLKRLIGPLQLVEVRRSAAQDVGR